MPLPINPDIRKAQTLPSCYYTDEALFSELLTTFSESWHYAGHEGQLSENGFLPLDHMETLVGEPMLMTMDGGVRCISNVCTHRGMLMASGPCSTQTLRCPYHGRTFDLDGCLRNMPGFEGVEGFPSPSDDLPSFPVLSPNFPLAAYAPADGSVINST